MSKMIESLDRRILLSVAEILADLNGGSDSTSPSRVTTYNGDGYFLAKPNSTAMDLYRTDGTAGGTTLVVSLTTSPATTSSRGVLFPAAGKLFFSGPPSQTSSPSLWVTDGTAAGTQLVPGAYSFTGRNWVERDGQLYFISDGTRRLYRTDGTTTVEVSPLNLESSSGSQALLELNGDLVFLGQATANNVELFKYDGTSVTQIAEINPTFGSLPRNMRVIDNVLYFSAIESSAAGWELWRSDGTAAGTYLVKDIRAGNSSNPDFFTKVGSNIYFGAHNGTNGFELWKTDGTSTGTMLVADLNPGAADGNPTGLAALGDKLLFQAQVGTNGPLFVLDSATDAYMQIGAAGPSPQTNNFVHNGELYYSTFNSAGFWKTDGTAAGTIKLANTTPESFSQFGSGILLSAPWDDRGVELWKSDLTAAGTTPVVDLSPFNKGSYPTHFSTAGGSVFFSAQGVGDSSNTAGLWISDGTASGTKQLIRYDIAGIGNCAGFTEVNGTLYFSANNNNSSFWSLWKTDGTAAGTVRVKNFAINGTRPSQLFAFGDKVAFISGVPVALNNAIWLSDGTDAGTQVLHNSLPGHRAWELCVVGDSLYFMDVESAPAPGERTKLGLWKSDGTTSGTSFVRRFRNDFFPPSYGLIKLRQAGASIVVIGESNDENDVVTAGVWVSDGTSSGTVQIGSYDSFELLPNAITASGEVVYFTARTNAEGWELWQTDGTSIGTKRLTDLMPGTESTRPNNIAVAGDIVVFNATFNTANAQTISAYDTVTETATALWAPGAPGRPAQISLPTVGGDTVYFQGSDEVGLWLWRTDGTAAGTERIPGLPQPAGTALSGQYLASSANGTVFFRYFDSARSVEPWILPPDAPPAAPETVVANRLSGNGVEVAWTRGDDMNSYRLQRSSTADFSTIDLNVSIPAMSPEYVDNAAPDGAVYYRLIAENPAGGSTPTVTQAAPAAPRQLLLVSDTGASATDRITNDNSPTFSGNAAPGALVTLYVDGVSAGATFASGGAWTITPTGLLDGVREVTAVASVGSLNSPVSAPLLITIDTVGPSPLAPTFNFQTEHRFDISFSESVGASLAAGDFNLTNLTTSQTIDNAQKLLTVATDGQSAALRFVNLPGAVLADGNYNLVIAVSSIEDIAGNPLTAIVDYSFFVFAGDANRDRAINITDFAILAARFNQPGTFSEGDFNYDGTANISDFAILASKFNQTLPAESFARAAQSAPRSTKGIFGTTAVDDEWLNLWSA